MMLGEHTRQTRWDHEPKSVDPRRVPPGSTYVRQLIWVPCTDCDLQVHAALAELVANGVTCPECGRQVASPAGPEGETRLRRLDEEEERFCRQLENGEVPCSD